MKTDAFNKIKNTFSKICGKISAFFRTKAGKVITACVSFIPALLALGIALYYIWGPSEGYLHSDCTDSLLWANASVESGRVFDPTFRYAGLLPFSGAMWMIPLIKIFGYGMTAQNIGMSIFILLFTGAVYFFCRAAGFGRAWSSASVAAVTLFLSSSDKLREILLGHTIYYSVAPLILFALGGCFLFAQRCAEKKKYIGAAVWALAIAFLCGGAATDGGQVIVIGSLPVIAGVLAERFFDGKDKLFCRRNLLTLGFVAVAGVGTVIGMWLLNKWLGDEISCSYANAYSGWSDIGEWADNLLLFIKEFFSLIGVTTVGESMFSGESIPSIIRIGSGLVIIAVPVIMTALYKKIQRRGVKVALWAHWVNTAAIMFGFICGKLSTANWRLTPLVATSVLVSVMGAGELCMNGIGLLAKPAPAAESSCDVKQDETAACERRSGGRVCVRLGSILLAVLMLLPCLVFKEIKAMPADYGRDNYKHALAEFLVEKNLKYGYATFWYSQAITILSDSETQCREVLATRGNGVYTDYYQSSRRWYTDLNYENYYVLLSESEYSTVYTSESWQYWTENYLIASYGEDDGVYPGFVIYVFSENVIEIEIAAEEETD